MPSAWDITVILHSLTLPSYEPVKLSQNECLTLKMSFFLALVSAKLFVELHSLSYRVKRSRGWTCNTFSFVSSFVAKTHNPGLQGTQFNEYGLHSLKDLVDGDREEILLCFIKAVKHYLSSINFFISIEIRKFVLRKVLPFGCGQ